MERSRIVNYNPIRQTSNFSERTFQSLKQLLNDLDAEFHSDYDNRFG